ncbi:glycoside hydrolase family 35 protein [Arthrobacter sp. D2-10]
MKPAELRRTLPSASHTGATFEIGEESFLLNGEPFTIIAGAMHYFRVHPGDWEDRLEKARLMGLNTIETYIAWNQHAPSEQVFDTSGQLDLARYLELIHAAGMRAIVRPGPFICAEWDNGGLPAWLFKNPEVGIRRNEPRYLAAVEQYFACILPIVAQAQIGRGGPVIAMQIENEFGAFGYDPEYLRNLVRLTRQHGIDVPLLTVDQPTDLARGSLPDLHKTASFGSRAAERLAVLREHQPTGPLMCGEFWNGWFDNWGSHHHTTSPEASATELDVLLSHGASVNIYMFHGGTNAGFTNGANDKGVYKPTVTSYDYDAPLDEAGDPTAKYHAFRAVIAKWASVPDELPTPKKVRPSGVIEMKPAESLSSYADRTSTWERYEECPSADDIGHYRGYLRYRTTLPGGPEVLLTVTEVRDRARVIADGDCIGVLARELHDKTLVVPAGTRCLEFLVEDMGRVNYGPRLGEAKGLIGPILIDGRTITGWEIQPVRFDLMFDEPPATRESPIPLGPTLQRGHFNLTHPHDLFLDFALWGKGTAWINGYHLGRFWRRGPQHTLYVPRPVTRGGDNELLLLEEQPTGATQVHMVPTANLGHTEP